MKSKKNKGVRFYRPFDGLFAFFIGAIIIFAIFAAFVISKHGLVLNRETSCANSISCTTDLSGVYIPLKESMFLGHKIAPYAHLDMPPLAPTVLGDATTGTKHIYVDLATQRLTAYQGNFKLFDFPVATGKWGRTPTGDFKIWIKLRYTHMEGGDPADGTYYNLYNVPYTMFYASDTVPASLGFSIHGAYWHNNFGHPMSHGCVNMRPEDAAKIYAWADPVTQGDQTRASDANPGTIVTITGEPPDE